MKTTGWIKLHRSFIDWEWYDQPNMVWLFIKCLMLANHEDKKWHGIDIKRGSFITSYENLSSKKAQVSVQQVRTALKRLKLTGEITIKTTNQYTHISINNYDEYQSLNTQNNKQITNKKQTDNKRITTTKELKNIRIKEIDMYVSLFNDLFETKYKVTNGRQSKLQARLKTYDYPQVETALRNLSTSDFHRGENDRGWKATPDFLIRNDEKLDEWLNKQVEEKDKKKKIFINLKGNYDK